MKKILSKIINCLAVVLFAFSSTGCNATTVESGYKTITQNSLKQASALEMLNTINQEEKDLFEFFAKNQSSDNDKVFAMLYKDLTSNQ